ncbi:ABC transporter permease subunit, partial [bacterium]|nr:ABC transporter permease subunit [bacterium]
TLSLLILPIIVISAGEAIKAVPKSIHFAAYALGARRWQVVFGQVLPAALPGIMTGVILAISRAIGETAPLIMIGALSYVAFIPEGPSDAFTVLPVQIYNWAGRPQAAFHGIAGAGIIILLAILFTMNFVAVIIRQRSQRYK